MSYKYRHNSNRIDRYTSRRDRSHHGLDRSSSRIYQPLDSDFRLNDIEMNYDDKWSTRSHRKSKRRFHYRTSDHPYDSGSFGLDLGSNVSDHEMVSIQSKVDLESNPTNNPRIRVADSVQSSTIPLKPINLTCEGESLGVSAISPFDTETLSLPLAPDVEIIEQNMVPMAGDQEIIRALYQLSSKVKIPKIIMQTWKNHDIPAKWRESPLSIQQQMPDWTYVLMTDEDNNRFCQKYFPDFWPYFRDFKYNIQRADAIRYMWLYVYGGIYMDMDIVIVHPLDDLFYNDANLYLCASGNVGSCITNSFMASKPRCQLWLDMLEHMKKGPPAWAWGKHMHVMNTTGPIALNYVVKNYGHPYMALPSKKVMPCSVCNIGTCNPTDSYLKPLVGSSWVAWDTELYNFFMCNWKPIVILVVLLIVLLLVYIVFKHKKYI